MSSTLKIGIISDLDDQRSSEDGNARIIELSGRPFYAATLFLPQLSSREGAPHPLVLAFIKAATANQ